MNYLFSINNTLKDTNNYIYGAGKHALHMYKYFTHIGVSIEAFCSLDDKKSEFGGIKIISISEFNKIENAGLLLTQNKWQEIYDELYEKIDVSKVFINTTWIKENQKCAICNHSWVFSSDASFYDFLKERMFGNEEKKTKIVHCPRCRAYYSSYRPTVKEMDMLYTGYRDTVYQKMREKYESYYTEEFNRLLCFPEDGGKSRRDGISNFIKGFIKKDIAYILDWGGDKGQFIPEIFSDAQKYVYEISGTDTINNVMLIKDKKDLRKYQWDIILCNMVLEHLSDVNACIKEISDCMSGNSLLYIEVPIERFMENSDYVFIHEHINFFREKTFIYLAKMNNMEILKISTTDNIQVLLKKHENILMS